MNYGHRKPSRISIVHTLPDGSRERVCSIPGSHISKFRGKMLEVEGGYPQGKRRHYTSHTKNARLARLEAALDYLGEIRRCLEGRDEVGQKGLKNALGHMEKIKAKLAGARGECEEAKETSVVTASFPFASTNAASSLAIRVADSSPSTMFLSLAMLPRAVFKVCIKL